MSNPQAVLSATDTEFRVESWERIEFTLSYVDGVFAPHNTELADLYRPWGRCLMVIDETVHEHYGDPIRSYFDHHDIAVTLVPLTIAETAKSLRTLERIVDAYADFGLLRTEPVLVVGGGLTTDVTGFACASYKRGTPYVRIPTTLIGLIDASVAMKVAVNHGRHKNRLGAFHASQQVLLDFSFLATLPEAQVRNGVAEMIKIATVANAGLFDLLEKYGDDLLATRFGHREGTPELRQIAHRCTYDAIHTMLELEHRNLHELDLDRVIAFGHTWSPTLELAPPTPMLHGHAIAIDMAFSATLAARRGDITTGERDRIHRLFSGLGLSVDSTYLTEQLLIDATASIMQTRAGKLRAALPRPIGTCHFANDIEHTELIETLAAHKAVVAGLPTSVEGVEMWSSAKTELTTAPNTEART
ncbi:MULTISPECIES: sedoheptulose 7-phosphate cyclase [unclassified Pseudonocardia]|uniref:sedoheptulose 7-phosphate cyclase n=1 Tax=unclassified Pseudonocardia TaxID=2619320 RepID=UPI000492B1F3|nr:sedoheptulose 7-phosphate cyclase [Pseudonocardia sp. Ae707_Ps1]OLM09146.1 Demethyl 4-deoxygadusol synthase MysA [Pseudonocardia sp. Ae707_Ps1]